MRYARALCFFFFSSRRRHTRCSRDWSSDVCSSDLPEEGIRPDAHDRGQLQSKSLRRPDTRADGEPEQGARQTPGTAAAAPSLARRETKRDRKSTRLNSSHGYISYAVFCLKKKKRTSNIAILTDMQTARHDGRS